MAINKTTAGTFRVDFRNQTGRRLRKTFDTLKGAREYDRISKGDITKGDFIAPSDVTVKDVAEQWYTRKKDAGTYRYGTLHGWRIHIDRHIVPVNVASIKTDVLKKPNGAHVALGTLKIQQCTVEHIENAAARWAQANSAKTANKILTTLGAIFKLAQRYGPLKGKANAAELAERLKIANEDTVEGEEVSPDQVYSEAELRKLIDATEQGSFERVLVMMPALTGMRIGQI